MSASIQFAPSASYGPVNLSQAAKSVLSHLDDQDLPDDDRVIGRAATTFVQSTLASANEQYRHYDGFPLDADQFCAVAAELSTLAREWSMDYPLYQILRADGTGLRSHMRADELPLNQKFQTGEDGGAGVKKQFRRLENPFGPSVVDGQIAARVIHAYDGTEGRIVKIQADQIVRPVNQPVDTPDNHIGGIIETPDEILKDRRVQDRENKVQDEIDAMVRERLGRDRPGREVYTQFSVNQRDQDDVLVNNLLEVAIKGEVVLVSDHDSDERGKRWKSGVLHDPTWLDLCVLHDDSIHATGDTHHCFLEGVVKLKRKDGDQSGPARYRLSSGS